MKISVTQEHINGAAMHSFHDCMVARALKEAGFHEVHVGYRYVYLFGRDKSHLTLPSDVSDRIITYSRFDVNSGPFEFELEIPA